MVVEPLNRLTLRATSVADDLGFVALTDLSRTLESDDEIPYRIIGGQMVMVLAARWGLGADLFRATLDADLGTPPVVVRDHTLVERLAELGYKQVAGDRFTKPVGDTTAGDEGDTPEAAIDILLPAYTSRPSQNRTAGDLVATEAENPLRCLQPIKGIRRSIGLGGHSRIQILISIEAGTSDVLRSRGLYQPSKGRGDRISRLASSTSK